MSNFLLNCLLMGIGGTLLSMLAVMYNLSKKAKVANVEYHVSDYFKSDWFAPVISLTAVGMAILFLPYLPDSWSRPLILVLFATIGYTGNDLVSRFFSVINKKIDNQLGAKVDFADADQSKSEN
jgi:hypothetical protein